MSCPNERLTSNRIVRETFLARNAYEIRRLIGGFMFNDSESYLDYVEIRRRVERRLASGQSVVIHVALFLLALLALVAVFGVPFYLSRFALVNFFMAGWSGLVFLHSVWLYRNGGTDTNRRLSVVQAELDERLTPKTPNCWRIPGRRFVSRACWTRMCA